MVMVLVDEGGDGDCGGGVCVCVGDGFVSIVCCAVCVVAVLPDHCDGVILGSS